MASGIRNSTHKSQKPIFYLQERTCGSFVAFSFSNIFYEKNWWMGSGHGSIMEISAEEIYKIGVSCVDAHLDRLTDLLRQEGWDVSVTEPRHCSAAKIWRR